MSSLFKSFAHFFFLFFSGLLKKLIYRPFSNSNPLSEIRITSIFSLFVAHISTLAMMPFNGQVSLNFNVVIFVSLFLFGLYTHV